MNEYIDKAKKMHLIALEKIKPYIINSEKLTNLFFGTLFGLAVLKIAQLGLIVDILMVVFIFVSFFLIEKLVSAEENYSHSFSNKIIEKIKVSKETSYLYHGIIITQLCILLFLVSLSGFLPSLLSILVFATIAPCFIREFVTEKDVKKAEKKTEEVIDDVTEEIKDVIEDGKEEIEKIIKKANEKTKQNKDEEKKPEKESLKEDVKEEAKEEAETLNDILNNKENK